MADFDLSLVASFDTKSAETGAAKVVGAIDGMAAAETRAAGATGKGKAATDDAARAERERAKALDNVLSTIEPNYRAQQQLNSVLADAERLQKQGAISLAQLARIQKLHNDAMKGGATNAGQARASYANLGFQIQDISSTLALGINPFVVFGQQAGQTAAALSGFGGTVGRVATFLSGPFGSVILASITLLGLFALGSDDATKSSDRLADSLDFQKQSTAELTEAIKAQLKEARQTVEVGYQQEKQAEATARANLKEALSVREKTKALLDQLDAQVKSGTSFDAESAPAVYARRGGVAGDVSAQDKNIARLEEILRLREIPGRAREAEAAVDGAAAATLRYEKAQAALNSQFRKGKITGDEYEASLTTLKRKREAETKAVRDAESAEKKLASERKKNASDAAKTASYASFDLPFSASSISSRYGKRSSPGGIGSTFHQGIDFAKPIGTEVKVPQAGVVEAIGYSSELGKYVVINHGGGTKTRYGHLSDNAVVSEKQGVEKGDVIGRTGNTGSKTTGPHLHYEVFVNGKRVDPAKGRFPIDDVAVAEAAEKAADSLKTFGDKSEESIARVTAQFDKQPRLIDQASAAARQLDAIIEDLGERKPPGFENLIADAHAAKGVIADSLLRPYEEILEASAKRQQIDTLIAAGREDEANALQIISALEDKLGDIGEERRANILATVRAEHELTDELRARQAITDAYLDATRSVRSEIEGILAGQGKLGNIGSIFKQLKAKVLTEQIFGPALRDLDKYVKENTGIKSSVDVLTSETERAGGAAGAFADSLDDAIARIRGASIGGDAPLGDVNSAFDSAFGGGAGNAGFLGSAFDGIVDKLAKEGGAPDQIVVTALRSSVNGLSPERYFAEMSKRLVTPLLAGLDKTFGTSFFGGLSGVVSGGVEGLLTAGPVGGILGALKGINGLPEGISKGLGKALGGAQTGTAVAGIGNALGLKLSSTGSQIGGAVGSFLPIPGGDIIGAIAGGLIGKLFAKTPYGTSTVTSGSSSSVRGNKGSARSGATSLGGSVQEGLASVAEALDAEVGDFLVSIGTYKDKIRVSTSGFSGKLKVANGAKDFGKDAEAAVAYAIADAIADGAITGISAAVAQALKSSPDIDKATREALKVADLEKLLKYSGDEFGKAFDDFRKVAADRVDLAKKYGLDLLKVEQLNATERQKLVDDAIERQVGSLKSLLDDLSFGSLFEGTASERRAKILGEIGDAKQDVGAGVVGATDRLADLERQLVETSRAAFGTAGTEYGADRADAVSTAQRIIEAETKRIEDAAAMQQAQISIATETNDLIAVTNGKLDTIIGLGGAGGTGGTGAGVSSSGLGAFDSFAGFNFRFPAVAF